MYCKFEITCIAICSTHMHLFTGIGTMGAQNDSNTQRRLILIAELDNRKIENGK